MAPHVSPDATKIVAWRLVGSAGPGQPYGRYRLELLTLDGHATDITPAGFVFAEAGPFSPRAAAPEDCCSPGAAAGSCR